MAVGFACRKVVGFVCRMVVDLLVGWLWGLLIGWLWALLVLESFLRDLVCWRVNIVCSKRESSLLERRKQPARIEKATSRNRL